MKTIATTVVVAALFAVVATEIHVRLLAENYLALLAMFFLVGVFTAGTARRFRARAPSTGRDRESGRARTRRPSRRAQTPPDAERETGTVKWFDRTKGYGFVRRANGDEIFVHHRSVRRHGGERASLDDGQTVSFVAVERERGWQAEDVVPE